MTPLTTYPIFEWLLNDSREAIEARAKLSGGTLVEMMKAADVEAMLKEAHATCIKLSDEARERMDIQSAQEHLYGAFVINNILDRLKGTP
jgi:hypothetical protein